MFLISSILHHHPALLHHHTLILVRLLTFLIAFYTLILKACLSQSLSLFSHLFPAQADLPEFRPLVVLPVAGGVTLTAGFQGTLIYNMVIITVYDARYVTGAVSRHRRRCRA